MSLASVLTQKRASDPRPPHTRQKCEQKSRQNMTQNASKQSELNSYAAICLFIFLPCMWGLGSESDQSSGLREPCHEPQNLAADSSKSSHRPLPRSAGHNEQPSPEEPMLSRFRPFSTKIGRAQSKMTKTRLQIGPKSKLAKGLVGD